jgi:hypothetical protein
LNPGSENLRHSDQCHGAVHAKVAVVRNGTFHHYLFPIQAVGVENVSYQKPVSFALRPIDRSHRLSNLLRAIHQPAQFLGSVLVNNSDLIYITVVVRHIFSP